MKSIIFWPLLVMLMLIAIALFGMLPADASSPAKPVVRLGRPYRAEMRRKMRQPAARPSFLYYDGIYIQWRNSVRFDALRKGGTGGSGGQPA